MVSRLYIILFLLVLLFVSCSTQKAIHSGAENLSPDNRTVRYNSPRIETETTNINELLYWGAPAIGGSIGYFQNQVMFSPNDNLNRLSSTLTGITVGLLTSYLSTEYLGIGYVESVSHKRGNKEILELMERWKSLYYAQENDFIIADYTNSEITLIPTKYEKNYTVNNLLDIELFNSAFPKSSYQKDIINSSLINVGISSVELLKKSFNQDEYLADEYLKLCDDVQKCYDFTLIFPDRYDDADSSAAIIANTKEKKNQYLLLFSEGDSKLDFEKQIQQEDYDKMNNIYDMDKFITQYESNDYNSQVKSVNKLLNQNIKDSILSFKNHYALDDFIFRVETKTLHVDNNLLIYGKERVVKIGFENCKTILNYKMFIMEYENRNYTRYNDIFQNAKIEIYKLEYINSVTLEDYKSFINKYDYEEYKKDTNLIIHAKSKITELEFESCKSIYDYEEFIKKYNYNEELLNIILVSAAESIVYENRFKQARNYFEFNYFVNKYKDVFDPDSLVPLAEKQRDIMRISEESQRRAEERRQQELDSQRSSSSSSQCEKIASIVFKNDCSICLTENFNINFEANSGYPMIDISNEYDGAMITISDSKCIMGYYYFSCSYTYVEYGGSNSKQSKSFSGRIYINGEKSYYNIEFSAESAQIKFGP